jgi:uncharacterized protein (TIGR02118 family)
MTRLVLLYQQPANPTSFQLRYRRNLALLKKMPGIQDIRVNNVIGGPAGQTSYAHILEITFADFEALDVALTSPEGVAAGKDLMDFAARRVELLFVEDAGEQARQPLTPDNLQAFIDNHEIAAEIVFPGAPTPTVPAAAKALNVAEDQIVKSVVFLVDGRPFLIYGCGTRRVDSAKLAARLDVGREKVRLASADEVQDLTGFAVDTVPPIGLKTPMPAFMDPAVQAQDEIYAGGGGIKALVKMTSAELLRVSQAEVAPMLEDRDDPDSAPSTP